MGPVIELNFYFTAIKKTYKIKVNPKECIWIYLYRFNTNEKELNGMIIYNVLYNDIKLPIDIPFTETEIKEEDTLTIESELPTKESENDNVVKQCIKPYEEGVLVGVYEGYLKNGKPEGNGRFFHILDNIYKGEWKEGKREGKGAEVWFNISRREFYEGEFKNDKRNGKGKLVLPDNEVYEGDWVDNKKEGKGKTTYPNGDTYEGDFKNGLPNGKGIIKWINGNVYEGEMKDDLMNGKGVIRWKEGHVYEGDFLNDHRTGKGIMKYNNGDTYEGEFLNGKYNGKGNSFFKDEGIYEGEWKDGYKNGKGIFKYINGDIYEGEFMGNTLDGFGKKTYSDGRIEEGLWENNEFMKDYNTDYSIELKCIKTLSNPNKEVKKLLQIKDGRLISASEDGTLNIYNKDSYEIGLSIKEHSDEIFSCIQLNDERLVTCSKDCTIKIIKLMEDNKYVLEANLESHKNEVLNIIEIKNNEIISISSDKTMKVWDLKTFQNIKTIENDCDNILKLNENEFVTSSKENKCIKFWNLNNYENIKIINNLEITSFTQAMCLFEENILLIGGSDILYFIDTKKYELINKSEIYGLILSLKISLDKNILCTVFNGNNNNHIIKYNYDKNKLTKIFEKKKASNNPIFNCIQLSNGNIVSAEGRKNSDSYEIKFWEIQEKSK